jgi:hypothetical protein
MGDTYDSVFDADEDRAQQKGLLAALNAWDRALCRDECGAWMIRGKHGSVHTWGDRQSWAIYIVCRSVRHWSATKARLSFCTVTHDGDHEGCLRLFELPTVEQAEAIREALGIRKRMEVIVAMRERLKAFAFERKPPNEVTLAPNNAFGEHPPPTPQAESAPILDAEPAK